jgi:hypothetical protein
LRGSKPASAPASCCLRHAVKCDVYKPSRRSIDAISPGRVALAASRKIRNLYPAVNSRRFAHSASSGSGRDPSPAAAPGAEHFVPLAYGKLHETPGAGRPLHLHSLHGLQHRYGPVLALKTQ